MAATITEEQKGLILDLLLKKISEDEFYARFPLERGTGSARGLALLQSAREARDPGGVEMGLYLAHHFGVAPEYVGVLCALAEDDWHEAHESVIDALAKLRAPSSVDVFYRVALANYPYRDYDEARSLGVKCIYALGKIQTGDAIERLGDLARSGEEILADEASKQLARVAQGAAPEPIRQRARELLAARGAQ